MGGGNVMGIGLDWMGVSSSSSSLLLLLLWYYESSLDWFKLIFILLMIVEVSKG